MPAKKCSATSTHIKLKAPISQRPFTHYTRVAVDRDNLPVTMAAEIVRAIAQSANERQGLEVILAVVLSTAAMLEDAARRIRHHVAIARRLADGQVNFRDVDDALMWPPKLVNLDLPVDTLTAYLYEHYSGEDMAGSRSYSDLFTVARELAVELFGDQLCENDDPNDTRAHWVLDALDRVMSPDSAAASKPGIN
jgi:hypothetical protein